MLIIERVGVLTHVVVKFAHLLQLVRGDAGALQQLQALFVFQPSGPVTGFPVVHEDFRIFRFVAEGACQATMVFMRVSQHDAADIAHC